MRREVRILLVTLVLGGLWVGGSKAFVALSAVNTFRVRTVEITGLDYLDRSEVLRVLHLSPGQSVWGDTDAWARRVMEHPLVSEASVRRRMPGTLVVHVIERKPVGLVPTPTLEAVDAEGVILPIDPAGRRVDLPIIELPREPAPGARYVPARGRALVAEVARFQLADTAFVQMVSDVAWKDEHTVVVRWSEPRVDFLLTLGEPARRLKEGLAVLADALGRVPGRAPAEIDLRYADQVVVRRHK